MGTVKAKLIRKVSATATLLAMEKGETVILKTASVKASSIRWAVLRLNEKGYKYEQTERGLINGVKVTRYK